MCFFRRIVYKPCAHAKFLGPDPVRKCHLQLAYECGETKDPCGKMLEHSYMSLKVDENCTTCAAKIAKAEGTVSRIKDQLAVARLKLKLRIPGAEPLENGDEDGDEALSPVDVKLAAIGGLGMRRSRAAAERE